MIGCEHCDEWYHGDCVNVTEKDAKYIKRYYCKECRDKNPNLHVHSGPENFKNSRQKTREIKKNFFFREIAFLTVLYFFSVQKLIFGHF